MDSHTANPPVSLIEDFKNLQLTILQDVAGEKTRSIVAYFRSASLRSQEMQLRATEFEEKEFAGLLREAFEAASRIVLSAWHKAHGAELSA